jgi:16S rRNA (cytosine967-C5)-methyltransferase
MHPHLLELAAVVVDRSGPAHPADGVLRHTLREATGLSRADSREISRAVFNHYRWFGWMAPNTPTSDRVLQARELADRFHRQPESFTRDELISNSVPTWLAGEMTVTFEFARALQTEPNLWVRAKIGQGAEVAHRLQSCRIPYPTMPDCVQYLGREDLFRHAEFQAGEFEVQDVASQVVGHICSPAPGETWWDACAGEGGKLLHLSDLMANKGLIWASDRAAWRLASLKRRAARARAFNYRTALWDGTERLPTRTKFDGVLVDAPCSGVGTWQRNPHARWTTAQKDVTELADIQLRLLHHAAGTLKPGGRLIYSVCSLTRAETTDLAQRFQSEHPDLVPLPFLDPVEPAAGPVAERTFWPQDIGGNGMYVVAWRRKA